jgi:hypothetical protein
LLTIRAGETRLQALCLCSTGILERKYQHGCMHISKTKSEHLIQCNAYFVKDVTAACLNQGILQLLAGACTLLTMPTDQHMMCLLRYTDCASGSRCTVSAAGLCSCSCPCCSPRMALANQASLA